MYEVADKMPLIFFPSFLIRHGRPKIYWIHVVISFNNISDFNKSIRDPTIESHRSILLVKLTATLSLCSNRYRIVLYKSIDNYSVFLILLKSTISSSQVLPHRNTVIVRIIYLVSAVKQRHLNCTYFQRVDHLKKVIIHNLSIYRTQNILSFLYSCFINLDLDVSTILRLK